MDVSEAQRGMEPAATAGQRRRRQEQEEEEEDGGRRPEARAPGSPGPCGAPSDRPRQKEAAAGREELSYELQQGYRILSEFLLEKHRGLTAPFLQAERGEGDGPGKCRPGEEPPLGPAGGSRELLQSGLSMCLLKMEEKFSRGQYGSITEFVADFRLMLETCYRLHGVDHWLSKQGQKLEMMLEQKLALLSRLREQERKEAEEASQKEIEEWERRLLAQAAPTFMENLWEIPAIGHFLCLAQQILNLPEIVFYELERCLLMPQCNAFLSKIMTSLLSPPHRRATLHRRPTLPYKTWEAALRQKVQQWYAVVRQTESPDSCAEKLGLCPQFFKVIGEVSPLEERSFHQLPFYQRVWLLKGLCDFVYETQKDVQDAVLGQPIHECREVILGYDYLENAYVHFPQFCGADVRIYKQKPFQAPEYPIPLIKIRRVSRVKPEKLKSEYVSKSNGEVRSASKGALASTPKKEPGIRLDSVCSLAKTYMAAPGIAREGAAQTKWETPTHCACESKAVGSGGKFGKPVGQGEVIGFGEPLNPAETEALENRAKEGEASGGKSGLGPLKENAVRICQLHVNGSHSDNPDPNRHQFPRDVALDHSLRNSQKLQLTKLRAKKKKKKRKLKDVLSETMKRKREGFHSLVFKSYKPEIHNKLFIIKKKAKHKKHKSGKKSISKNAIIKKRKAVRKSPTVPEFQLICTNLDELRELITKIESELRDLENHRKKTGKWNHRRQAVKELHSTLMRLLNELLPWEPKLVKAFQRNRSRLKKDYDEFIKQPDHDMFSQESWTGERAEVDSVKESARVEVRKPIEYIEHLDIFETERRGSDALKLSEINFPVGKSRLLKKEFSSKDVQKTLPKTLKRQYKQSSYLDNSTKELSPRKKAKLSTSEATVLSVESGVDTDCSLRESKQTKPPSPETVAPVESTTSGSSFLKGTKPIQALLAKNIGNKVTLTNQLPPSENRNVTSLEKPVLLPLESGPMTSEVTCQTNSKGPLQMVCKMPYGPCGPVDLPNHSVKIQRQSATDPTTGEKVVKQILILPKNFLIEHKEGKAVLKEIQSLPEKVKEKQRSSCPPTADVSSSLAPVLVSPPADLSTQLPSTIFNSNFAPVTNVNSSRPQPLPSETSASHFFAAAVKPSQSEPGRVQNTLAAVTFPRPVASPTISVTAPPVTLSRSPNPKSSANSLAPEQAVDSPEAKQELKTVCIRDSQSILVRTRGGNTGVVKVQTNPDQNPPNSFTPSSVFTYAPQLQTILVPKSTPLSAVSGVATTSCLPPFGQGSVSGAVPPPSSVSIPAIPAGVKQPAGKDPKLASAQSTCSGHPGQATDKAVQVTSSSPSSILTGSSVPLTSSGPVGGGVSTGNPGKPNPHLIRSVAQLQVDFHPKKSPVTRPETTLPTNGELAGGPAAPKLVLVTAPSIISSCSKAVSVVPTPVSAGVAPKLVFINAPIPGGTPTSTLIAESLKQALPPSLSNAYVKNTEQPQIVLIPTVANPIKINPSPTVSQIKDVKIGLNIGQAIVNTPGSVQSVPSISLIQNAAPAGSEEQNSKGFVLPLSTSGSSVAVSPGLISQAHPPFSEPVPSTRAPNVFVVTTAGTSPSSVSAASNCTSGTRPAVLVGGNDTSSRIVSVLANSLCTPALGSAVAISTVKTGHLASSVLISTSQPTVSPQCLPSALQIPVTVALPAPAAVSPRIINAVPPLAAVPGAAHSLALPKRLPQTLVQFQTPGLSAPVPANASLNYPPALVPSASLNAGKTFRFANFAPLPSQHMPLNLVKPAQSYSCIPVASAIQTSPGPTGLAGLVGGQLNDTCIQQKIVINTNTPLAPGTQIMINGSQFAVPPQGLGVGSHVLLITTNPFILSSGPVFPAASFENPAQKVALIPSSALSQEPENPPPQSATKIVNSPGNASTQPSAAEASALTRVPAATRSSAMRPPPPGTKAPSAAAAHDGDPRPGSPPVLNVETPAKKLLVSPEGAILNAINSPQVPPVSSPCSQIIISTSPNPATVFPAFQSPGLQKPDRAAS
uniref:Bromodomain containing 10 n=1 Tax=Ornithorhynchus anatinus TaxID=9258 RepID=A0A6I8NU13_ORNAN